MSNTATEAQIKFIQSLSEQRDTTDPDTARALELGRALWRSAAFTKEAASAVIDALKAAPYAESLPDPAKPGVTHTMRRNDAEVPEGMHVFHGTTYKVQVAKNGSGRRYAKVLEQHDGRWIFVYAPGVIRDLSEATCMSAEEAAQFGALYGICCNCARDLTDERSIAAGYGPVCAANNGWPWG